jgi:hypothetical protein
MGEVDERYKRGMIYTIRNITDDTLIYVGSTINTLPKRFDGHKQKCKNGSKIKLYNYITDNNWSDWYIELYENFPCNNKNELERKEGQVIREIGTINKRIEGRTKKEYDEDNKEKRKEYFNKWYEDNKEIKKKYCEDNAEKISERMKKYRQENVEIISERMKKYYEDNAEKISEKSKEYYENNKEKVKERMSERVCCDICGTFLTKGSLRRHQRSKKCTAV